MPTCRGRCGGRRRDRTPRRRARTPRASSPLETATAGRGSRLRSPRARRYAIGEGRVKAAPCGFPSAMRLLSVWLTGMRGRLLQPAGEPGDPQRKRAQKPQLPHQAEGVGVAGVLDDPAAGEAADSDSLERDLSPPVGAVKPPSRRDPVALAHLLVDLEAQVGKD